MAGSKGSKGPILTGAAIIVAAVAVGLFWTMPGLQPIPATDQPGAVLPLEAAPSGDTAQAETQQENGTGQAATAVAPENRAAEKEAPNNQAPNNQAAENQAAPRVEKAEARLAEDAEATTAEATPQDGQATTPEVEQPRFDVVRVDPDGAALIAGQATPGSKVTVLLDGKSAGEAETGADGRFVSFLDLGSSDAPRVLTLSMNGPDDAASMASADQVILAPSAPQVAQAAPADKTPSPAAPSAEKATGPDTTVAAEPAPTVLLSDADGVRVLQGATAPEPDQIALDAITYDPKGGVSIAGRGRPGAFARIYLDDQPVAEARISDTGNWTSGLSGVAAGDYDLRIDQLDDKGTVTSRVETPFRREPPKVAADAMADSPARQITVQKGNTLWAIARNRYGEGMMYVQVFNANRGLIRNPDLIYPGQIFSLPDVEKADMDKSAQ